MTILQQAHQQTVLWRAQRETCLTCRRCITSSGRHGEKVMHCDEAKSPGMRYGYCIDARSDDGCCGPDAKLFQPKEQP